MRLTKLAGDSTTALVSVDQQPGLTQGEINLIGGGMDFSANLNPGPAYGPSKRSGGEVLAGTCFVKTVEGGLTFNFRNGSWSEGGNTNFTLELEVLVLPLAFS